MRARQVVLGGVDAVALARYPQVERIAHVGFRTARVRSRRLCSVDKMNVLECTQFWRDIFEEIAKDYPDVALSLPLGAGRLTRDHLADDPPKAAELKALRKKIRADVAAEVGFLAMDLDAIGRRDMSRLLVRAYAGETGDDTLEEVMPFFCRYRAVVRGLVAWATAVTFAADVAACRAYENDARRYFSLALSYRMP